MKLVLALAVLATSAASIASSRDIYDIMYLPKAGTTYGFSTLSLTKASVEYDDSGESLEDKTSSYIFEQTVGRALTDRLTIQASFDYKYVESRPGEGSEFDAIQGISDPTISARFRLIDESFRFDIAGGATLSLMDAKADTNNDGNIEADNHQGGHSLFVGTQFGAKSENFQWAIAGTLTHKMEAEREYATSLGDVKFEDEANNELLLRGDILNKLAESSFLRSNVAVAFTEKFEDDEDNETAPTTTYQIGTEYQHLASQDLLLRAGVDYSMVNDRTGQIDSITGWTLRFGANYQF